MSVVAINVEPVKQFNSFFTLPHKVRIVFKTIALIKLMQSFLTAIMNLKGQSFSANYGCPSPSEHLAVDFVFSHCEGSSHDI
jgi:hypothetical protein